MKSITGAASYIANKTVQLARTIKHNIGLFISKTVKVISNVKTYFTRSSKDNTTSSAAQDKPLSNRDVAASDAAAADNDNDQKTVSEKLADMGVALDKITQTIENVKIVCNNHTSHEFYKEAERLYNKYGPVGDSMIEGWKERSSDTVREIFNKFDMESCKKEISDLIFTIGHNEKPKVKDDNDEKKLNKLPEYSRKIKNMLSELEEAHKNVRDSLTEG